MCFTVSVPSEGPNEDVGLGRTGRTPVDSVVRPSSDPPSPLFPQPLFHHVPVTEDRPSRLGDHISLPSLSQPLHISTVLELSKCPSTPSCMSYFSPILVGNPTSETGPRVPCKRVRTCACVCSVLRGRRSPSQGLWTGVSSNFDPPRFVPEPASGY